ncbi:hypothetical protein [Kribbella sp. NBC_00359]
MLATEFAVKRMEAMRPRIAAMIEQQLDTMLARGGRVHGVTSLPVTWT